MENINRQEQQQQEINLLNQRMKQQNEAVKRLLAEYKAAKQKLDDMTKERDEMIAKNTQLQNEQEEEKKKLEAGHNKVDNSLVEAKKTMDELEASILEITNFKF